MGLGDKREGSVVGGKLATAALWVAGLALVGFVASVPLDVKQQFVLSAAVFVAALLLRRSSSRLVVLALMGLSLTMSTRYIWWRLTRTMDVGTPLDLVLGSGLLVAELYAFLVLVLGYFQVAWPLNRRPVPLPQDQSQWPTVDVFIPTYNEPLAVVRTTVLAASVLDWPEDKLNAATSCASSANRPASTT
jgi:Glycosyltransferases, probably involved in cell wall biogenesis